MNDETIIQAMKELDIDQVLKLWNAIFDQSFLESSVTKEDLIKYIKRNPDVSSVACTSDGKVIGALLCGHDVIRGFIYHIAIYNEYRVSEIRKRMIDHSLLMLKKVLLNVFYNIAIFTMVLCLFWGFNKERYSIVIGAAFAIAIFVFFKIRLIRQFKNKA